MSGQFGTSAAHGHFSTSDEMSAFVSELSWGRSVCTPLQLAYNSLTEALAVL